MLKKIWQVETIVCFENYERGIFKHIIELPQTENEKQKIIELAKMKTKKILHETNESYRDINICWLQKEKYVLISHYKEFVRLYESRKSKKEIMRMIHLPFWKFKEFESYYLGKTRVLTYKKYLELRRNLKDEEIRRRYKIPKCEFKEFLMNQRSCAS